MSDEEPTPEELAEAKTFFQNLTETIGPENTLALILQALDTTPEENP